MGELALEDHGQILIIKVAKMTSAQICDLYIEDQEDDLISHQDIKITEV